MLDAVIGLGSNLGARVPTLISAVRALQQATSVITLSPLFRSAPVGGPAQAEYYNAAARIAFAGDAHQLLVLLHGVEAAHGRERREHWGPRTLDLDLLWIAGVQVASAELTVPHARLTERAFALMPLVALVPNAEHPTSGERFEAILRRLGSAGVQSVTEPDWESLRVAIAPP